MAEDHDHIKSVIALLGPPRSGTTLIANAMMAHSKISGIIEPYHTRRAAGYDRTTVPEIMRDFELDTDGKSHLVIKETTTRIENISLSLDLLASARHQGMYTALGIILRCPFSAYLSQVEASENMWKEKKLIGINERTLKVFCYGLRTGLTEVARRARAQHFRLISYEAFAARPANELARLMALVPVNMERGRQMSFTPPKSATAGDPKTQLKSGGIFLTDRKQEIEALRKQFGTLPEFAFLNRLRMLVNQSVCKEPDDKVLDKLTLLLIQA